MTIGQLLTAGRAGVTALGDEVDETARIEACATGGRALGSKALVERVDPGEAEALGLVHPSFTMLTDLEIATERATRDAPALSVCELL